MIAVYDRKRSTRDTAMTRLAASNRAAVRAAADSLAARGLPVSAATVAREAGLRLPTATGHLAALRREGLVPPPPKGGGPQWSDRTGLALAAVARLVAGRRAVTAASVAAETGLANRQAANLLSRLRASGLVAPVRERNPPERPAAPAAAPAAVWPPGRPEEWADPAMACLYYRREWKRARRSA